MNTSSKGEYTYFNWESIQKTEISLTPFFFKVDKSK